jgi:hypothetical protein
MSATLKNVTYIVDEKGARWTGIGDGAWINVPLKGVTAIYADGHPEICNMSGVTTAISGWLGHSLINQIRKQMQWAYIVSSDIYGDCVNNHGKVYIPLQELRGKWGVPYPVGLAVLDEFGHITIYTENIPEGIPGPTYPESVAKNQENGLNTHSTYSDFFWGNYGFQETGGEGNPNSENSGQYNLTGIRSGTNYFVTPLTKKGSSQSIDGITVISVKLTRPGVLNPAVYIEYPQSRTGVTVLADTTKKRFPDWSWVTLGIQELVPGPGTSYVGYVGQPTVLNYLVTYNTDGSITAVTINPEMGVGQDNNQPATPVSTSVPTVQSQSTGSDLCNQLWGQLNQYAQERDVSMVLSVSAQLLQNNCTK